MSWHAIDALDDARSATRGLLFPFDLGTWLRLALVAVFVGAGASTASVNANVGGTVTPTFPGFGSVRFPFDDLPPFDPGAAPDGRTVLYGVAAALGAAVLLALAFSFVSAVMQFVLVRGLADRSVRIRGPFRAHFGKGLRLWAFEVGAVLLALLAVGVPVALVALGGVTVGPGLLLALLPVFLFGVGVAFALALLFRLTTDFVVPTMLAADRGVLGGWRRLYPTLRAEWEEFALYVVIRFALGVVVGALFAAAALFVAVLVALPFAAVAVVVLFAFSGPGVGTLPLLALALLAVVVLLYLAAVAVAGAALLVPVVTFFRYYSLFVLGRLDAGLDLVGAPTEETGDGPGDGGPDDDLEGAAAT